MMPEWVALMLMDRLSGDIPSDDALSDALEDLIDG